MASKLEDPKFRAEFEVWASRYLSGDNCQPFYFDWTMQEVAIRYEHGIGAHIFNQGGWASALSLGSLIAHIELFAYYRNIDIRMDRYQDYLNKSGYCLRCRFDFTKEFSGALPPYIRKIDKEYLRSSIFARKTVRNEMQNLREEQLALMLDGLSQVWKNTLYLNQKELNSQLTSILEVESIFYKSKDFFSQTFNWIRTSPKEYRTKKDGMYIDDLGLNYGEKIMTGFMKRHVNLSAWLLNVGGYKRALRVNEMQFKNCDGLVLFWGKDDSNLEFLELGIRVTYFIVYLWSLGIGVQPVSLLTQFLRENWTRDSSLFKVDNETTKKLLNYFKAQGVEGSVLWGMRVGQLRQSYVSTLRRNSLEFSAF